MNSAEQTSMKHIRCRYLFRQMKRRNNYVYCIWQKNSWDTIRVECPISRAYIVTHES